MFESVSKVCSISYLPKTQCGPIAFALAPRMSELYPRMICASNEVDVYYSPTEVENKDGREFGYVLNTKSLSRSQLDGK